MEPLADMAVFAKVVETRGFSAAARQLGLTTSAVSRSVARLEAHIGAKLLHRTTRAVSPTEIGREVYAGCALIAATARDVVALAGHYAQAPRGRLKVSAPVVFGQVWLAPRLAPFLAQWPEIELELSLVDRMVDVVEEGIDVALRIAPSLAPGLAARPLFDTAYVLAAAPRYLRAAGTPAQPEQLAGHAVAYLGYGEFRDELVLLRGERKVVVPLHGRVTVNNSAAIATLVEAGGGSGIGIGLIPDFTVQEALAAGRLLRLLPDWNIGGAYRPRPVYAVYAPTRHLPQKVRAFIDFLAAARP